MAFATCQHVMRFQVSKCDCISQHINHKVIVLSKCLLLVQFCLAHVFSPGTTARALWKSVLLYRHNEFPNLCLLASLMVSRVKFFRWAHIQFYDKYLVRQAPFHEPRHTRKLRDSVRKQFHLERERKGGNYRSCVRDISQQTQNHHLWSRLGHSRNWWWTRWRWPGQWRRTLSRRINGF